MPGSDSHQEAGSLLYGAEDTGKVDNPSKTASPKRYMGRAAEGAAHVIDVDECTLPPTDTPSLRRKDYDGDSVVSHERKRRGSGRPMHSASRVFMEVTVAEISIRLSGVGATSLRHAFFHWLGLCQGMV